MYVIRDADNPSRLMPYLEFGVNGMPTWATLNDATQFETVNKCLSIFMRWGAANPSAPIVPGMKGYEVVEIATSPSVLRVVS